MVFVSRLSKRVCYLFHFKVKISLGVSRLRIDVQSLQSIAELIVVELYKFVEVLPTKLLVGAKKDQVQEINDGTPYLITLMIYHYYLEASILKPKEEINKKTIVS